MQKLTQPQVNLLKNLLVYARGAIQHPNSRRIIKSKQHQYEDCVLTSIEYPSSVQIRKDAEKQAIIVEEYEKFLKNLEESLSILKALDYSEAMKETEISTEKVTKVKLGEFLAAPEKFPNIGKRKDQTVITETSDDIQTR